jgi:hypothetical protein
MHARAELYIADTVQMNPDLLHILLKIHFILSSHLCLGLQCIVFLLCVPIRVLNTFLLSSMHAKMS